MPQAVMAEEIIIMSVPKREFLAKERAPPRVDPARATIRRSL